MRLDDVKKAKTERAEQGETLEVVTVSSVTPEAVNWLWLNYLAIGHLTLLGGDPGQGKSQILTDCGARLTKGARWPSGAPAPVGDFILLSSEDGLKDTIRPRLEAAGADLDCCHVVKGTLDKDGKRRTFSLQNDLDLLACTIEKHPHTKLIGIDPITAYMGSKIDSYRTTDVRAVLEPVQTFAEFHRVAILGITHPPKAAQAKATNAFTGSLAFMATARLAFLAAPEPETDRKLLLGVKNNLGPLASGRGYYIVTREITAGITAPHILWDDAPVDFNAAEAMHEAAAASKPAGAVDRAKAFLNEFLSDGARPTEAVEQAARGRSISVASLRRARQELGIISRKAAFHGGWELVLP
jgi:putative DNA primase/helicase